jgi:hypothetical protein
MQIKTTLRFHFVLVRTPTIIVGEDVGKKNPHILLVGM